MELIRAVSAPGLLWLLLIWQELETRSMQVVHPSGYANVQMTHQTVTNLRQKEKIRELKPSMMSLIGHGSTPGGVSLSEE